MFVILLLLFLKALLLGFMVAAPVGPVGALVIRRTLHMGRWMGFATGTGSALGDTLYAIVAALGLSAVEDFLKQYTRPISFGGGVILLFIGITAVRNNFKERQAAQSLESAEAEIEAEMNAKTRELERKFEAQSSGKSFLRLAVKACMGSFLITVTNPVTVVGFAGSFTAFGFWSGNAPTSMSDNRYLVVVLGVLLGALAWWMSLSSLIHWLGNRLSKEWIFRIHLSTSLVILLSGIVCFGRGLLQ